MANPVSWNVKTSDPERKQVVGHVQFPDKREAIKWAVLMIEDFKRRNPGVRVLEEARPDGGKKYQVERNKAMIVHLYPVAAPGASPETKGKQNSPTNGPWIIEVRKNRVIEDLVYTDSYHGAWIALRQAAQKWKNALPFETFIKHDSKMCYFTHAKEWTIIAYSLSDPANAPYKRGKRCTGSYDHPVEDDKVYRRSH